MLAVSSVTAISHLKKDRGFADELRKLLVLLRNSAAAAVREAAGSSGRAGGVKKCGVGRGGINRREGGKAVVSWDL